MDDLLICENCESNDCDIETDDEGFDIIVCNSCGHETDL
jgi:hypothetical protein